MTTDRDDNPDTTHSGEPAMTTRPHQQPANLREAWANVQAAADDAPNRPFKHGQHLVLSLVTCGLWLPVWGFAYGFHQQEQARRRRVGES